MSFSLVGPWLHALWAHSAEAGRGGTVSVHLGRVLPTPGRVAQEGCNHQHEQSARLKVRHAEQIKHIQATLAANIYTGRAH